MAQTDPSGAIINLTCDSAHYLLTLITLNHHLQILIYILLYLVFKIAILYPCRIQPRTLIRHLQTFLKWLGSAELHTLKHKVFLGCVVRRVQAVFGQMEGII